MANYSSFSIDLTGNIFQLKAAYDVFKITPKTDFSIDEVHENYISSGPLIWNITGSGRWGLDIPIFIELISKYCLSGTITDSECGSDFFIQAVLVNGKIATTVNEEYMSDAHYEYCNDNAWWCESYEDALKDPENNPEVIQFFLRNNIITQEELDGI